jgi:hypothetical protein
MLMELGNGGARGWWGTVQAIEGIASNGCFVWPANIVAVLGINTCHGVAPIRNFWYTFTEPKGLYGEWARRWDGRPVIEFDGQTCLYRSIAGSPTQIQVIADNANDIGSQITLYGLDANGVELSTTVGGVTQRGCVLTVGPSNKNFSTQVISRIDHVAKNTTYGKIHLLAYANGVGGEVLADYAGGDVNPKFLFSRVAEPVCAPGCAWCVKALVKLGFSSVVADSDIIPLDNVDAIKLMVQSIRASEAGDVDEAAKYEKMALRRLVAQVNSRFPLEQFEVAFRPFGTDGFNRVTDGMI